MRSSTTRTLVCALWACAAALGAAWAVDASQYSGPSNAELDAAREWLWAHPPDGTNRAQRLEKTAVIEAVCNQFPSRDARRYVYAWSSPERLPQLEKTGAAYYLRKATDLAIKDLRRTAVTRGMAAWYLYNMGYVFKTPSACFGIDLCLPDAARLVKDLDFLLVSHGHLDHNAGGLARAMIAAGKPVITNFLEGSTIVKQPAEFHFGPARVKVDLGDHTPRNPLSRDDMLMFQADSNDAVLPATIYHTGDDANYRKMTPDKPVDVLIVHVACSGMRVADAIRHVHPKMTLVSHLLELTHDIGGARWTYEYALDAVKGIPENEAVALTWGERWLLPGTILRTRK